jgi:hypothetical protein
MDKRIEGTISISCLGLCLTFLGEIEEGEKPDFVILASGVRIGIEHTTLFHHGPRVRAREAAEEMVARSRSARPNLRDSTTNRFRRVLS